MGSRGGERKKRSQGTLQDGGGSHIFVATGREKMKKRAGCGGGHVPLESTELTELVGRLPIPRPGGSSSGQG